MTVAGWSTYIEYAVALLDDDVHDRVHELLADHAGAPTTAPNGNFAVALTIDAPTAEQAVAIALDIAGAALRAAYGSCAVVGIEVMTEAEQDRRNAAPAIPELAGRAQVAEILGVAPNRADQIIKSKQFVEHVRAVTEVGGRPLFRADTVRYFAKCIRTGAPGRPASRRTTATEK